MNKLSFDVKDGIAVLRLDNPPVNSLGIELREALVAALARANADPAVAAIVLIGSGTGFSGGADIREFSTPKAVAHPNLRTVISEIEDSGKPVIAAIGGVCMGGGLELAMACDYRIGVPGARIALPEVKLGLLPGAGGTQRLPRLLGVEAALNMIVSGATFASEKLRDTPLFDAFGEGDLLESALTFARRIAAEKPGRKRVRDLRLDMPNAEAYLQFARNTIRSAAGPYPAPLACLEAVAAAVEKPFDAGLKRERELFTALMLSPESAALRHVFQAERAASHILDVPADTPIRPIRKVGVIGAGTMGGGIAMSLINAGLPVVLLETQQDALDRGMANIRRNYQGALRKGTLNEQSLAQRLALITPTLDYATFRDVDLSIEAVFENMDVKRQVFETLDDVVRPGAILASNTSALNLDEIANFTRRPQDVIGLHFFSPANVMRLLEVVRGAKTAKDVLATAMHLSKAMGKAAVVSGVCDGFIGNRMLARYGAAAHDLLMFGALPHQIDAALQDFGMAMGPFRVGDLAGLDIGWALRKRRAAEFPGRDFSNVADVLCEAGRFGQKTGAGWYRYDPGSRHPVPDPKVTAIIEQYRRQRGITPRNVGAQEIVERCIYALINEGARIIEDGIAQRASDIDLVYLNGYGFPAYRGGPMFFADQTGLHVVARALEKIAAQPGSDPNAWTPAPLLARLAHQGQTFNGFKGSTP
ncbi:MAG TPA: 3-hydroxyacyl-CoA dehydrogenase NAD-binding domain-containing protein [Steroidobacteraceae bacterium]|nr:3-hydroxyacyl-CoA dehydrogenase NAD-binding domain-containing protein [Steroidobacteraceae bacterium]